MTWANGDSYHGEWKDNAMSGLGTFKYSDGTTLQGQFVKDYSEGYGIITWENGDIYEGEWKDH